jgi:proline dehydrogenase
MIRKALGGVVTRILNRSARHYIAGSELADALHVCRQAEGYGWSTTIGAWNADNDPPHTVFARYSEALDAIIEHRLRSYLSIKVACLGYDEAMLKELLAKADPNGVRIHFDSLGPETADPTFVLLEKLCSTHRQLGCTLPAAWARSVDDAQTVTTWPVAVRVVKGQWPDPHHPDLDVKQQYVKVIDRLAGRSFAVGVGTHDVKLAADCFARLQRAGTPFELEQLFGLPLRVDALSGAATLPVRIYVPYGEAYLIYASAQVRRPVILLWLLRDMVLRHRSRYRLTGKGF